MLELDSGERIAQSPAILWYLAEGTPFLPDDRVARAHVLQWLAFEQERVMGGIGGPRFRRLTGRPPIAGRLAIGEAALALLDDAPARPRLARRRRLHDRRRRGVRLRPRRRAGGPRARTARARVVRADPRAARASSPISPRTARTRGPARAGRSTADVGSPAWQPEETTWRPPARRPRRAARRRGARGRALALPLDGDRPGAARRADRGDRLDVDRHDAVQPHAARAVRRRGRGRRRRRRRRAPVQHDRGLRQPVPGHARDARVADLARGDRRLDRADVPSRTTSTRCCASSAATRRRRRR